MKAVVLLLALLPVALATVSSTSNVLNLPQCTDGPGVVQDVLSSQTIFTTTGTWSKKGYIKDDSNVNRLSTTSDIFIEDCCAKCSANPNCVYFSYAPRKALNAIDAWGVCTIFNIKAGKTPVILYDKPAATFTKCDRCPVAPTPPGVLANCPKFFSTNPIGSANFGPLTRQVWGSVQENPLTTDVPACYGSPLANSYPTQSYLQGALNPTLAYDTVTGLHLEECYYKCFYPTCLLATWVQTPYVGTITGTCYLFGASSLGGSNVYADGVDYAFTFPTSPSLNIAAEL